jgi:HEAT repeat protein
VQALLAVAALCLGPLGESPVEDDGDARRAVDRALAFWQAQEEPDPAHLSQDLVRVGRPAVSYLCELLESRPKGLPAEPVAIALSQLAPSRSVVTFAGLLESPVEDFRVAAVAGLGACNDRTGMPLLVLALDDPAEPVAERAEEAILDSRIPRRFRAVELSVGLRTTTDEGRLARVLGRLGGLEAHDALRELLDKHQESSQMAAMQGLWLLPMEEDGPAVLEVLEDSLSTPIRKQACLLLGKLRHRDSVHTLIELLKDKDRGLRENAHWGLRKITGLRLTNDPEVWEMWREIVGEDW